MSKANDVALSLKIMINKQKTKVLFAEADSDFTDILFSFLTLPLGKIAKLLHDHYGNDDAPSVGSLSNLYRSVANIHSRRFTNEAAKQMLLYPRSSFEDVFRDLKFDISNTQPAQYFTCEECNSTEKRSQNICVDYGTAFCDECGEILGKEISVSDARGGDGGVFTLDSAIFMISDDLLVVPSAKPFLQTLTDFGIDGDINGAVMMNVTFGVDEIVGLLKLSLLSKTPLTDLILNNRPKFSLSDSRQNQPKISLHGIEKNDSQNSKNISLRVTVQKSTNKLLFAQAEADFVELLFSFLTIPLGGVASLLNNNTCLKNVDNLHMSLADAVDDKYFTTPVTKNRLMNPKLAHGYASRKQFLPLCEESAPIFYYRGLKLYYNKPSDSCLVASIKSPQGPSTYVKEPSTYLVTDDLTVTSGMAIALTILDQLNIPLSDLEEREVNIGLEEALRILKASLTSTSALSSGLQINQMPEKLGMLLNL